MKLAPGVKSSHRKSLTASPGLPLSPILSYCSGYYFKKFGSFFRDKLGRGTNERTHPSEKREGGQCSRCSLGLSIVELERAFVVIFKLDELTFGSYQAQALIRFQRCIHYLQLLVLVRASWMTVIELKPHLESSKYRDTLIYKT